MTRLPRKIIWALCIIALITSNTCDPSSQTEIRPVISDGPKEPYHHYCTHQGSENLLTYISSRYLRSSLVGTYMINDHKPMPCHSAILLDEDYSRIITSIIESKLLRISRHLKHLMGETLVSLQQPWSISNKTIFFYKATEVSVLTKRHQL
ncbi:hypothetical protein AVEN_214984-1 [Araneus ventricosus]|uniref:Uncharacterized protein n=1 Tax=Araneus ventricosus TaxID=182803 RepID=A0A4Y2KPS5_ARAVE|nr:hypothetical protein AVEN_214984-1 [Araneus ventricosus]